MPNSIALFDLDVTGCISVAADGATVVQSIPLRSTVQLASNLRKTGALIGSVIHEANLRSNLPDRIGNPFGNIDEAIVFRGDTNTPELFAYIRNELVERFGDTPVVYVSAVSRSRESAKRAGVTVAPHPKLVSAVLRGLPLRYLRVRIPDQSIEEWLSSLAQHDFVPLGHAESPGQPLTVYGISDVETASTLDSAGFWVDRLGDLNLPLTHDLYIFQSDGRGDRRIPLVRSDTELILTTGPEGRVLALPSGRYPESVRPWSTGPLESRHLSGTIIVSESAQTLRKADAVRTADTLPDVGAAPLKEEELSIIAEQITADDVARIVDQCSGASPLPDGSVIRSRHLSHPDNAVAVHLAESELRDIGLSTRLITIPIGGRPSNVEGVLAGSLTGVVTLCAHLDSTAQRDKNWKQHDRDSAPGADDNATGMAGVLLAARAVSRLSEQFAAVKRREIRFILFNAEEGNRDGSPCYALELFEAGTPIVAAIQMDMIGYSTIARPSFELHAGYTSSFFPDVQPRSLRLAEFVRQVGTRVSETLLPAQIYPNSEEIDPAEGRSDHTSFHEKGFTACLLSEDFFAGPSQAAPPQDPNPNYHTMNDKAINKSYAVELARIAAAAIWMLATR